MPERLHAPTSDAPPRSSVAHDPLTRRVAGSCADLTLVLDRRGEIVDVWLSDDLSEAEEAAWTTLVGRQWADTVLPDSRRKVERLLANAFSGTASPAREVNQHVDGLGDVPIRFGGVLVDDDHVIAPGQDLRPLAEIQQRLVSSQQAMDREYRRLRQADTRYRVLFHVCSEGVLVVRGDDRVVEEANPAATELLGADAAALAGSALTELFTDASRDNLLTLLGAVEAGAAHTRVQLEARSSGEALTASASMFRQSGSVLMLLRFWPVGERSTSAGRETRMLDVLDVLPDGFVVTDEDRRILSANAGFCDIVQRIDEDAVVGKSLDTWLGRPGLDLNIILANLREYGVVRDFATVIRTDFGVEQEAVVTAVSADDGKVPCYGFSIRTVASPRFAEPEPTTFLPRSVEQLRGLVGRVSLKEIVKESTDLIERLCIEAALDVSNNNRAAAAQLLGLSRQSLYSKLRRHGLGELDS
ncbi:MAG: transcriptional regulator PpsR [Sandaracinus sp.]|nr:transcriptional regulator PpsR [Myxococcales bacterium]MAT24484.1 transcriptional regulator PpsR [Sandaracinus sp.]MBJ73765.1 transcriptional regulator PpsR [Sandaracinus sp.]